MSCLRRSAYLATVTCFTTSAVSGVDDNELTAGAFIVGHKYTITSVGNTDFTAIGASGNTVGVVFTATGVGSGTGQAKSTLFYDTTSSTTRVVAYVNGIKQVYGSGRDFVATTGTSVAFTYNLGSGDTVDIQVYELLTNDAYYIKSEVYTQTEVNSQISTGVSSYLPLAGGTMTGNIVTGTYGTASTGTGFRFSGSDIYAQTNAQDRIRLNTSGDSWFLGNVGIGTTSPSAKLHIVDGNNVAQFGDLNSNSTMSLRMSDTVGSPVEIQAYSDTLRLRTHPSGGSMQDRLTILSGGNVGIGTTSPSTKLHIQSTSTSEPLALFKTVTGGDASIRAEGVGGESYIEIANTSVSTGS